MIYQEIVKRLKVLDYGNAIWYASANAFELQELHDQGHSIDSLVEICLNHK